MLSTVPITSVCTSSTLRSLFLHDGVATTPAKKSNVLAELAERGVPAEPSSIGTIAVLSCCRDRVVRCCVGVGAACPSVFVEERPSYGSGGTFIASGRIKRRDLLSMVGAVFEASSHNAVEAVASCLCEAPPGSCEQRRVRNTDVVRAGWCK